MNLAVEAVSLAADSAELIDVIRVQVRPAATALLIAGYRAVYRVIAAVYHVADELLHLDDDIFNEVVEGLGLKISGRKIENALFNHLCPRETRRPGAAVKRIIKARQSRHAKFAKVIRVARSNGVGPGDLVVWLERRGGVQGVLCGKKAPTRSPDAHRGAVSPSRSEPKAMAITRAEERHDDSSRFVGKRDDPSLRDDRGREYVVTLSDRAAKQLRRYRGSCVAYFCIHEGNVIDIRDLKPFPRRREGTADEAWARIAEMIDASTA